MLTTFNRLNFFISLKYIPYMLHTTWTNVWLRWMESKALDWTNLKQTFRMMKAEDLVYKDNMAPVGFLGSKSTLHKISDTTDVKQQHMKAYVSVWAQVQRQGPGQRHGCRTCAGLMTRSLSTSTVPNTGYSFSVNVWLKVYRCERLSTS